MQSDDATDVPPLAPSAPTASASSPSPLSASPSPLSVHLSSFFHLPQFDRSLLLLSWSDEQIGSVQPGARRLVTRLMEAVALELMADAQGDSASPCSLASAGSAAASTPADAAADECATLRVRILRLLGPSLGARALQHVDELRQAQAELVAAAAAAAARQPRSLLLDRAAGLRLPLPMQLCATPFEPQIPAAAAAPGFSIACIRDLTACLEWLAIECMREATAASQRKDDAASTLAASLASSFAAASDDRADILDWTDSDEDIPEDEDDPRPSRHLIGVRAMLSAVSSSADLRALVDQLDAGTRALFSADRYVGAEESYPHTHSLLSSLCRRSVWYHRSAEVRSLLQRWLAGEATPCSWITRGIRPVAWLGVSCQPQWSSGRPVWNMQRDYTERSNSPKMPYAAAAFDLIDAEGREFPLLVETLVRDVQSAPQIRVFDRSNGCGSPLPLLIASRGNGPALIMLHAARFFARYAAKADNTSSASGPAVAEPIFSLHTNSLLLSPSGSECVREHIAARAARSDPALSLLPEAAILAWTQLLTHICEGAQLSLGFDSAPLSAFTLYHPPSVVSLFSCSALRSAFDSPEVGRSDFPDVLIELIAQLAPVDLPQGTVFDTTTATTQAGAMVGAAPEAESMMTAQAASTDASSSSPATPAAAAAAAAASSAASSSSSASSASAESSAPSTSWSRRVAAWQLSRAAPKRPLTAYMLFSAAKREEVKRTNPDLSFGPMAKKIGQMWMSSTDEDKQVFVVQGEEHANAYRIVKTEFDARVAAAAARDELESSRFCDDHGMPLHLDRFNEDYNAQDPKTRQE